jgi:hypothetical protein
MLSISQENLLVGTMVSEHDAKFRESQLKRIEAIAALKAAGDALIAIRTKLREAGASTKNPVTTDLGTFTSFDDYVKSGVSGVRKTYAYDYITLAENWDIVLKLGMQDTSNEKTLANSMRLARTLRIIRWYKEKVAQGCDPDTLTLDLYWEEQEPKKTPGPTKEQLKEALESVQVKLNMTEKELEVAYTRITELEAEVHKLRAYDARQMVPSMF